MKKYILMVLGLGFLYACAPQKEIVKEKVEVVKEVLIEKPCECTKYEIPPDWKDESKREEKIKSFSNVLSGIKFFIDPGHGGKDRHGKSKDGSVIEADVNLRVALNLKNYLEKAGCTVFISRTEDSTVDLRYRSELANKSGADFFVSIHHNAPGNADDTWTNFTSTYYHATEDDYEYNPCNRDLARYIQRDLAYVMDNSNGLGSFDGTYSDYNIYPKEGFSVLRRTEIPAVLVECSFFSNPTEQRRLNIEEFNAIQAWGIFRGIGRYFTAGIPSITFVKDKSIIKDSHAKLVFNLFDKKGINPKSIQVFFDSSEIDFVYDKKSGNVTIDIENLKKGEYEVKVIAANKNNNHSLPFIQKIKYK